MISFPLNFHFFGFLWRQTGLNISGSLKESSPTILVLVAKAKRASQSFVTFAGQAHC